MYSVYKAWKQQISSLLQHDIAHMSPSHCMLNYCMYVLLVLASGRVTILVSVGSLQSF